VTSDLIIKVAIMVGCAGFNLRGSYRLWRDGLHCATCARMGRPVYAVLLAAGSAMAAACFVNGDWIEGTAAGVIVASFVFDFAFINRFLDRQEKL
jgi:hypothetical protein